MYNKIFIAVLVVGIVTTANAATITVPQTGETACYNAAGTVIPCPGTGQDGEKQAGAVWPAPRFTDNADGTITDNLTNLIWLKNAQCFTPQPWLQAISTAAALANGQCGLNDNSAAGDWRLPNVNEMDSLTDLSGIDKGISPTAPFTNIQDGIYWTSTTHAHFPANAWIYGGALANLSSDTKTSAFNVWPVRSKKTAATTTTPTTTTPTTTTPPTTTPTTAQTQPPPAQTGQTSCFDANGATIACPGTRQDGDTKTGQPWPTPRFTDNKNGTITDTLTGLIWLKDAGCLGLTNWQQALNAANTLAAGTCGLADGSTAGQWRLPNRNELLSLSNYEQADGATWLNSQGFVNGQSTWYWTSDTVTPMPTNRWIVHAVGAAWPDSWVGPNGTYYVIAVRGPAAPAATPAPAQ